MNDAPSPNGPGPPYKPRKVSNLEAMIRRVRRDPTLTTLVQVWEQLDEAAKAKILDIAGEAVVRTVTAQRDEK